MFKLLDSDKFVLPFVVLLFLVLTMIGLHEEFSKEPRKRNYVSPAQQMVRDRTRESESSWRKNNPITSRYRGN